MNRCFKRHQTLIYWKCIRSRLQIKRWKVSPQVQSWWHVPPKCPDFFYMIINDNIKDPKIFFSHGKRIFLVKGLKKSSINILIIIIKKKKILIPFLSDFFSNLLCKLFFKMVKINTWSHLTQKCKIHFLLDLLVAMHFICYFVHQFPISLQCIQA